jgi:hypothetical protein
MVLALALSLAIAGQSIPPPLPKRPSPEELAAAAALYRREPYGSENSWGIAIAASQIGGAALDARGARTSARDFALAERLRTLARRDEVQIIDAAIGCVAQRWAQGLSVADLEALKAFIATPAGQNFWRVQLQDEPWQACFKPPVTKALAPVLDAEVDKVIAQFPKP